MSNAATREVERRMERIEALIQEVDASTDPVGSAAARALVATLLEVHSVGLGKVLGLLAGAGDPGRALATACAKDADVRGMLALHELEAEVEVDAGDHAEGPLVQLRVPRREQPRGGGASDA